MSASEFFKLPVCKNRCMRLADECYGDICEGCFIDSHYDHSKVYKEDEPSFKKLRFLPMSELLLEPVASLCLPLRMINLLGKIGVSKVRDLVKKTKTDLRVESRKAGETRYMGASRLMLINETLKPLGLSLREG